MKCIACKAKCTCMNSRDEKFSGADELLPDKKMVKERQHTCNECGSRYITQEYLAQRTLTKAGKEAILKRKKRV